MPVTPRLAVFMVPAAICAAWTVWAGKDVNWDLLNYHYYAPFALLAGRLQQDFFAASAQSYLNPLGYLPFYAMVASGWHSVIASIILALAHSLSIALLYLIAWRLFAHLPRRDRVLFSCLAAALGTASSVFWATVGSSFLDPLLLVPMLAAVLILLEPSPRPQSRAAVAGALFGAAAALKYSNAVFALAALPLALALPGPGLGNRLRAGLAFTAGGALAVMVLAGPWLALMFREFGNPVFPLLNAWFQSPHAPAVNPVSVRFTPADFATTLAFPFRMLFLDRSLYSETFAPDLRFAALIAGVIALPVLQGRARSAAGVLRGSDWRAFAFLAVATGLWLATSANGRYGMVVLLLAGVCLARIIERAVEVRTARIALLVLLALQLAMMVTASPARWFISAPWSSHWLPYDVPERARLDPALYLSVESLPMAVVAPFLHPRSAFANLRGLHSLATDSPRLATLLERHSGRVRALGRALELIEGKPRVEVVQAYDRTLVRIGYRVDAEDCFTIAWQSDNVDALSHAANRLAALPAPTETLSVVSCGLRPALRDREDLEREKYMSVLFDRMEKACPRLFRGQTAVTEPLGTGWSRHYAGLDARLEAGERGVVLNRYRAAATIYLGRLSDWEGTGPPVPAECARR